MQAILNVEPNEVDEKLLKVIKELLLKDVEVTIRKPTLELKEFDRSVSIDEIVREFSDAGYSQEFISDLKVGFETSEIYK